MDLTVTRPRGPVKVGYLMRIYIYYLVLLLSLLFALPAYATVPVARYNTSASVQVCIPSDTNSNCGGGGGGAVSSVSASDASMIVNPTTGAVGVGVNWQDFTQGNLSGVNWNQFVTGSPWASMGYLTTVNWAALTILNGTGVNWSAFYPTSNPSGYITNAGINWSAFPNTQGYLNTINWAGLTTANGTGVNWQSFYPTSNPSNYISNAGINWNAFPNTQGYLNSINWAALTTVNGTGVNWSAFYPTSNPFSFLTAVPWGSGTTGNMTGINWSSFYPTSNPLGWLTSWTSGTTTNMTGINWQSFFPTASMGSTNWSDYDLLSKNQTITGTKTFSNTITGSISGNAGTATSATSATTAANLSGTPALPNGTTATTQSIGDNSTKLATTAYVNAGITGSSAVTIAAGGSNQNVTLTPSGNGYTVLNGNVGIGTASPAFSLDVPSENVRFGSIVGSSGNNINVGAGAANTGIQVVNGYDLVLQPSGGDVYTNAWADYSASSTIVGWSSFTTKSILYKRVGKLVFVQFNIYGTSNANTASFTVPYATSSSYPSDISEFYILATDNGNGLYIGIFGYFSQNSQSINFANNYSGTLWTSSGTKGIKGQFWYQSA
jgi:hypothetical protein